MTGPGPIALLGGYEHRAGCQPIDRRVLDEVGAARPRIAVIPVASAARQLPLTAALARNHWGRLGARIEIVVPRRADRCDLDAVAASDVIVLPGGYPDRLVASLGASVVWDRVLDRWRQGAALVGSSAGAMALFEWRVRLLPPRPLKLVPGLGPLGGYIAAPHFDRFRARRWGGRVVGRLGGLGVIGLDERTGLVGRDGRFTVDGPGSVTVMHRSGTNSYTNGAVVALDALSTPLIEEERATRVQSSPARLTVAPGTARSPRRLPLPGASEHASAASTMS